MARLHPSAGEAAANGLLAALPRRDQQQFLSRLEIIPFQPHQILHEAGEPIPYLYFLCGGLVSLLTPLERGKVAEVAVVGKEGVVGLPLLLGGGKALYRATAQCPGKALRMPAAQLRGKGRLYESLNTLLLRYAGALLNHVSQLAACNCHHSVSQRFCRWLLLARDRIESDSLPLTQKSLALMLTVRRATVSEVASALQRSGLIRLNRGHLIITNREGLENSCCACYRIIKGQFDGLLG